MEGKLTCRGLGHSPPDTDENLRILRQKIIRNFTFVITLMILIKQCNYHIHRDAKRGGVLSPRPPGLEGPLDIIMVMIFCDVAKHCQCTVTL